MGNLNINLEDYESKLKKLFEFLYQRRFAHDDFIAFQKMVKDETNASVSFSIHHILEL